MPAVLLERLLLTASSSGEQHNADDPQEDGREDGEVGVTHHEAHPIGRECEVQHRQQPSKGQTDDTSDQSRLVHVRLLIAFLSVIFL